MNIVHVTPKYTPNVGYQENYLPKKQQELGHDVTIVTSSVPSSEVHTGQTLDGPGTYEYDTIPVHRLETWFDISDGGIVVMKRLEQKIATLDPDVIHAHTLFNFSTPRAVRYGTASDVPVFADVHVDNDNLHIDTTFKRVGVWGASQLVKHYIAPRVESFLAVNHYAEELLREEFSIRPNQIRFLPLGVDTTTFTPNRHIRSAVRSKFSFSDEELVLVTAGNLTETKDIDVLLRAFHAVAQTEQATKLLVIGNGPEEYVSNLETLAKDLELSNDVVFTGSVPHEDLPGFYNAADIGVWPGKLGISTVEAIGTGLPCIVCESAATRYLVSNDNGLTFERGDHAALAELIKRYSDQESLRRAHATNAATFASDHLAWDRIAKKSIEMYRSEG